MPVRAAEVRVGWTAGLGTMAAAVLTITPVSAAEPVARVPVALDVAAQSLAPGQYFWRDYDTSIGDIAVVINRGAQVAYVYRGATLVGVASVSTGKPGKTTPLGDFTILQKKVFHRSNIYSNAPMPYMQRLTWTGIALHAGHNPGYPASHGCIRLPREFAALLYGVTRMGASVAIVDDDGVVRPVPREEWPEIVADIDGFDGDRFTGVTWTPSAKTIVPMLLPPEFLRRSTGLSVLGDEWLVPDTRLLAPEPRRRRL
jgi:hypothetical protein